MLSCTYSVAFALVALLALVNNVTAISDCCRTNTDCTQVSKDVEIVCVHEVTMTEVSPSVLSRPIVPSTAAGTSTTFAVTMLGATRTDSTRVGRPPSGGMMRRPPANQTSAMTTWLQPEKMLSYGCFVFPDGDDCMDGEMNSVPDPIRTCATVVNTCPEHDASLVGTIRDDQMRCSQVAVVKHGTVGGDMFQKPNGRAVRSSGSIADCLRLGRLRRARLRPTQGPPRKANGTNGRPFPPNGCRCSRQRLE
ncbi:hypothetical protein BCR44DRAFT_358070 [Catenaria anguillulae PL171]|uniref:Uncharacterized protein n=1 Tax=Catenaria anguillulae PL171 TaxID=765915 RepID=A0A1Y2H9E9_9FUNG|nr:hypothetical protein BCR44DRAFT_358070 [Catenaria anguillulae PL171]